MTSEQIEVAAIAAIRAMDEKTRAYFIASFEAGHHDVTVTMAQAFAVEGVSRQVRLCSVSLEDSRKMNALADVVYEKIS